MTDLLNKNHYDRFAYPD